MGRWNMVFAAVLAASASGACATSPLEARDDGAPIVSKHGHNGSSGLETGVSPGPIDMPACRNAVADSASFQNALYRPQPQYRAISGCDHDCATGSRSCNRHDHPYKTSIMAGPARAAETPTPSGSSFYGALYLFLRWISF